MIRVVSIFTRIGLGGGGKVKAVRERMNALAQIDGIEPVLLSLEHGIDQKLNFATLQADGTVAEGVRHMTQAEACDAGEGAEVSFPAHDQIDARENKTVYLLGNKMVMTDRTSQTAVGTVVKRRVPHRRGAQVYTLVNGRVHQMVQRMKGDVIEITDYANGLPVRWHKREDGRFAIGRNLVTGTICRMERVFYQNIHQMIDFGRSVVFFDGVTSAYLASVTRSKRVLFLHADHRGPDGDIVPRSRYLLENFDGEALVTSTHVHKRQIEVDVVPAAPVHVIPHVCDSVPAAEGKRRNLVTVSRLELTGKPIPQCIEAFCQVMDEFPLVDYLIYGLGAGQGALEAQIAQLGCGDRVRLEGYTTAPLEVFGGALASVYPTTTEGFGLSILEALAAGCPVITNDVNYGPRELITSGQNGELVSSGDIAGMADAMRRVLSDPQAYQSKTTDGLERYSRAAYLDNYRNLIEDVAGSQ